MTSASDVEVGPAAPGELPAVRALMLEYADALDFSLDFQDFEGELASLPGEFAPPGGALLVARTPCRARASSSSTWSAFARITACASSSRERPA